MIHKTFNSVALILALASSTQAATYLIDLTTDTGNGSTNGTGVQLDVNPIVSTQLPLTVDVYDTNPNDLGTVADHGTLVAGLSLIAVSGSSIDSDGTTINASGASLGLNSPGGSSVNENSARFDVDHNEVLTLAFSQPVTILAAEFGSFSGQETFTIAGTTFGNSDYTGADLPLAGSDDVFNFADNGGGVLLSANEPISFQAGGPAASSVGLVALTIDFSPVPEPSSALLGLLGLALGFKRRR